MAWRVGVDGGRIVSAVMRWSSPFPFALLAGSRYYKQTEETMNDGTGWRGEATGGKHRRRGEAGREAARRFWVRDLLILSARLPRSTARRDPDVLWGSWSREPERPRLGHGWVDVSVYQTTLADGDGRPTTGERLPHSTM